MGDQKLSRCISVNPDMFPFLGKTNGYMMNNQNDEIREILEVVKFTPDSVDKALAVIDYCGNKHTRCITKHESFTAIIKMYLLRHGFTIAHTLEEFNDTNNSFMVNVPYSTPWGTQNPDDFHIHIDSQQYRVRTHYQSVSGSAQHKLASEFMFYGDNNPIPIISLVAGVITRSKYIKMLKDNLDKFDNVYGLYDIGEFKSFLNKSR
jgi:hypothetical protein